MAAPAAGDLFLPLRTADGSLTPFVGSPASAAADLGVPVRLADGNLTLIKVVPCVQNDLGFPARLADGKLVLVKCGGEPCWAIYYAYYSLCANSKAGGWIDAPAPATHPLPVPILAGTYPPAPLELHKWTHVAGMYQGAAFFDTADAGSAYAWVTTLGKTGVDCLADPEKAPTTLPYGGERPPDSDFIYWCYETWECEFDCFMREWQNVVRKDIGNVIFPQGNGPGLAFPTKESYCNPINTWYYSGFVGVAYYCRAIASTRTLADMISICCPTRTNPCKVVQFGAPCGGLAAPAKPTNTTTLPHC